MLFPIFYWLSECEKSGFAFEAVSSTLWGLCPWGALCECIQEHIYTQLSVCYLLLLLKLPAWVICKKTCTQCHFEKSFNDAMTKTTVRYTQKMLSALGSASMFVFLRSITLLIFRQSKLLDDAVIETLSMCDRRSSLSKARADDSHAQSPWQLKKKNLMLIRSVKKKKL
jgi:hypothetical protein